MPKFFSRFKLYRSHLYDEMSDGSRDYCLRAWRPT